MRQEFPFRSQWLRFSLAGGFLALCAAFCFYGASASPSGEGAGVGVVVGLLCLVPVAFGFRQATLANASRPLVVSDDGVSVPHAYLSTVTLVPWRSIRGYQDVITRSRGVKVGRSLTIDFAGGSVEVREQSFGADAYQQIKALVSQYAPPPSPEYKAQRQRHALVSFLGFVAFVAALAGVGYVARHMGGASGDSAPATSAKHRGSRGGH